MSDLDNFFEQSNGDVAVAFQRALHYLDHPDELPTGYFAPNLLRFFADALKAENYDKCEEFMTSPDTWIRLIRFRRSGTQNARDYFDVVLMRANARACILDIPDGIVRAGLEHRVAKVRHYLRSLSVSVNEIDRNNSERLTKLYSE